MKEEHQSFVVIMSNAYDSSDDENEAGFEELQSEWLSKKDMEESLARAREPSTTASYVSAVDKFKKWCFQHRAHESVANVLKDINETAKTCEFDLPKLAESMETVHNPYCHYTRAYQLEMNKKQKSGIGTIATLRSGLSDLFCSEQVELSSTALLTLTKWKKSRNRDDMKAKMRDENPVKFTNARSNLPVDAFEFIAQVIAATANVQFWLMWLLQWNMISRVSQTANVMFNKMTWDNDHFVARHGSSKKDKSASRSFNMAIHANRYKWYLCPILALAIWLSITVFPPGGNKLFPGSDPAARYSKWLDAFFIFNVNILAQWADLLGSLGSHSVRKGATNRAGHGGLVADVMMPTLLRGLWDIGNTLQRYFKENLASDSLVGRILAGYDVYSTTFRALPPHFVTTNAQQERLIDTAVINQFTRDCPLMRSATQKISLRFFLASLVHHYEAIDEALHENHPLRETWIFTTEARHRANLKRLLGPEFAPNDASTAAAGAMSATGIPPTIAFMVAIDELKEDVKSRDIKLKVEITEMKSQMDDMQQKITTLATDGVHQMGPDAMKTMLNNGITSQLGPVLSQLNVLAENMTAMQTAINTGNSGAEGGVVGEGGGADIAVPLNINNAQVPPNNATNETNNDTPIDISKITEFPRKMYLWKHTGADVKPKHKINSFHLLPKGYQMKKRLPLSKLYKLFHSGSGTKTDPIPPLNIISKLQDTFSNGIARSQFKKARGVVKVMDQLIDLDEAGRTLRAIYADSRTVSSLDNLAAEGFKRILHRMPPPKKQTKRSRPEALTYGTVYNVLKKIKTSVEADVEPSVDVIAM